MIYADGFDIMEARASAARVLNSRIAGSRVSNSGVRNLKVQASSDQNSGLPNSRVLNYKVPRPLMSTATIPLQKIIRLYFLDKPSICNVGHITHELAIEFLYDNDRLVGTQFGDYSTHRVHGCQRCSLESSHRRSQLSSSVLTFVVNVDRRLSVSISPGGKE